MKRQLITVPKDIAPILAVVIHTEEEFDWNKPHDRSATGVTHMRHIDRAQGIFEEYGIVPNYVVDYPIAATESAFSPLKQFQNAGRAVIGCHLHPWVSPPFTEELNTRNSYPGNLPADLEREKLRLLTEIITESFGTPPRTYLAGRYGFGPNTASILEDLGYEVDISAAVPNNFTNDGGPDYSDFGNQPYWFGQNRKLLGLPGNGGYVGLLRGGGSSLYKKLTHPLLRQYKISGIIARTQLLERVRISPEDYSFQEMQRLTRVLVEDGIRVLVFSFHSPSVMPGGTPYVRNESQLNEFLGKCRQYFDFFFNEMKGKTMTPLAIRTYLEELEKAGKTGPLVEVENFVSTP